uniref:MULE transposase domain-containing protein n=1 Tax=Plectus sambesii TaxID=2011161 RepID=A0A914WZQ3_9BILA
MKALTTDDFYEHLGVPTGLTSTTWLLTCSRQWPQMSMKLTHHFWPHGRSLTQSTSVLAYADDLVYSDFRLYSWPPAPPQHNSRSSDLGCPPLQCSQICLPAHRGQTARCTLHWLQDPRPADEKPSHHLVEQLLWDGLKQMRSGKGATPSEVSINLLKDLPNLIEKEKEKMPDSAPVLEDSQMFWDDDIKIPHCLSKAKSSAIPSVDNAYRLPCKYKTMICGKPFLMHDNQDTGTVAFASNGTLHMLQESIECKFDGMFKSAPATFNRLIQSTASTIKLNPSKLERILLDFEWSAIKALKQLFAREFKRFGHVKISGCRFHYSQAIVRNADRVGLKAAKRKVHPIRHWIQRILCLSLLLAHLVQPIWSDVLRHPPRDRGCGEYLPVMRRFIKYFKKIWLADDVRIHLWNHYDNQGSRTTNAVEGYHLMIKRNFSGIHPKLGNYLN